MALKCFLKLHLSHLRGKTPEGKAKKSKPKACSFLKKNYTTSSFQSLILFCLLPILK